MNKRYILILLIIISLTACSLEEKIIDSSREHYRIFVFNNLDSSDYIYEISSPTHPLKDNIKTANSSKLSSIISKLVLERNELFLLSEKQQNISIFNAETFNQLATIDLSKYNLAPKDIVFHSGGTSAFVIGKASKSLIVINMLTKKTVNELIMPDTIGGIAVSGPSIIFTLPSQNKTLILDNQTLKISTSFDTPDYPTLVSVLGDANKICVLCPGVYNNDKTIKTDAYAYFFNIIDRKLLKKVKLEIKPKLLANSFYPTLISSTEKNEVLFSDNIYLVGIDASKNYRIKKYNETPIDYLYYSKEFDGIFIAKDNENQLEVIELSPTTFQRRININIYPNSIFLLPIK